VQADRRAARFPGLINAVLRRITQEAPRCLPSSTLDGARHARRLYRRWKATFGAATARRIAWDIMSRRSISR